MSTSSVARLTLSTWERFAPRTLVAPVHSPFSANGSAANTSVVTAHAAYLAREGFNAVFVCGTNGESYSCSVGERKAMLEAWMRTEEVRTKALRVIAHISCLAMPETVELAKHAAELGVDAVAYMAPSFFRPSTAEAVAEMLASVAAEVPATAMIYYHFPGMNGVDCSLERVLTAANKASPNVVGAKFTHSELGDLHASLDAGFDVLVGSADELLLSSLVLGSAGGFSVPGMMGGNRALLGIFDAFEKGDIECAALYQGLARRQMALLKRHPAGFIGAGKALAAKRSGVALGPPRLPVAALSNEAEMTRLEADFEVLLADEANIHRKSQTEVGKKRARNCA